MSLFEFSLLAPVSLFLIINPFSIVPAFLAITPGDTQQERIRAAQRACIIAAGVVFFFAVTGKLLFSLLGLTLPAFQIAGGALLFVIAFEMLRSPDAQARLTAEEREIAKLQDDVAITPLAVPLLCGPGAISTIIILQTQTESQSIGYNIVLLASVPVVYLACYLILRFSAQGAARLSPIALRITKRLMGLLFAAIAVQFIINGVGNLPFVATVE